MADFCSNSQKFIYFRFGGKKFDFTFQGNAEKIIHIYSVSVLCDGAAIKTTAFYSTALIKSWNKPMQNMKYM